MADIGRAAEQAVMVVDGFVAEHRQAAIPALIGACVLWAVENGGAEVVRGSLEHAIRMSRQAEREMRKTAQ